MLIKNHFYIIYEKIGRMLNLYILKSMQRFIFSFEETFKLKLVVCTYKYLILIYFKSKICSS